MMGFGGRGAGRCSGFCCGSAPQASGVAAGTGATGFEAAGPGGRCTTGGCDVKNGLTGAAAGGAGTLAVDTVPPGSSEFGTGTAAWQNGHFTFFPDDSSRARNRFPHDGHPNVIGMLNSAKRFGGQGTFGRRVIAPAATPHGSPAW